MQNKARVGDTVAGACIYLAIPFAFTGTICNGSTDVLTNGKNTGQVGKTATTNCPSCAVVDISKGSTSVLANGLNQARIGDQVTGPSAAVGIVMSGSTDVLAGG